ncbi:methyltransferase family protein [Terricaulis sp.]|uniref:methyltransferase family protein n=1 Tax=Terricaulis sp. TaxID=2768686 RepID=UPI0037841677
MPITPASAIAAAWLVWLVVWIMTAGWSARAASHEDMGAASPSRVLTLAAIVMIIASYWPIGVGVLWTTPQTFGWALFALTCVGFAFAWWGRLHLGPLWSSTASPTDAHRIVDTGPYGIVRHPVYAGLLLAALAMALESGRIEAVVGALLLTLSLSMRAKVEERILRRDVGDADYTRYRARVPMLIPGLKNPPREAA